MRNQVGFPGRPGDLPGEFRHSQLRSPAQLAESYIVGLQTLAGDVVNQVLHTAGVSPLVVVLGNDLHAFAGHHTLV